MEQVDTSTEDMVVLLDLAAVVAELQDVLVLGDAELAWIVGVDQRTVRRWRANRNFPQGEHQERLVALEEVVRRLSEVFTGRETVHRWLQTEIPYLGGMTPADALRARRIDRVNGALEALASGFLA